MGSVLFEQVDVGVLNLDCPDVQGQLVLINEAVMTIAQVRAVLKPKKSQAVRKIAVSWRYLYTAIKDGDAFVVRNIFDYIRSQTRLEDALEKIDRKGLSEEFFELVGKDYLK